MTMDPVVRRALSVVLPYWRRLVLVLALSFASTVTALWVPLLSRDIVDGALLARNPSRLFSTVGLFAAVSIATFVLNIVSGLRYTRVSADILFDMRLDMYRHLQRLSPRFYARTRVGDIMSRINNDIGELQRIAAETALGWFGNLLFLLGTIGMLAWLDLRLFVVAVMTAPPAIWALIYYQRRVEARVRVVRERSADIGSFLIDNIQGMRLVVSANAQAREEARFRRGNDGFVAALMKMQLLTYFSGGMPGLILSAGTSMVFLYGGMRVIEGTLTFGTFIAFMAYQMRFLSPLQALMGMYGNLATARVSLQRVTELLEVPIDVRDAPLSIPLTSPRGEVTFDKVSLSFGRGEAVLNRVSFTVKPGETLAIIGPSGSGKSTIADLIVRLLDPDSGTIRLDGHDLRSIRLSDLRRHVAVVDQQPFIMHTTIAENIRYARPGATDAEVVDAALRASLDPFVRRLPEEYQTVVGERGAQLSAGERQRLALARAFLANPTVLVLDEPSSALDVHAERRIAAGYERVMRGRTTIVITHRAELAARADRVLALEPLELASVG
jgi:ATP-binding cassette, subfamily B, bacterial